LNPPNPQAQFYAAHPQPSITGHQRQLLIWHASPLSCKSPFRTALIVPASSCASSCKQLCSCLQAAVSAVPARSCVGAGCYCWCVHIGLQEHMKLACRAARRSSS
jgi:hypothetical protein